MCCWLAFEVMFWGLGRGDDWSLFLLLKPKEELSHLCAVFTEISFAIIFRTYICTYWSKWSFLCVCVRVCVWLSSPHKIRQIRDFGALGVWTFIYLFFKPGLVSSLNAALKKYVTSVWGCNVRYHSLSFIFRYPVGSFWLVAVPRALFSNLLTCLTVERWIGDTKWHVQGCTAAANTL